MPDEKWWEEYVDLCIECPTDPKKNVYHVLPEYIPDILAEHRRMILEEVVFAVGKEYPFWEASCCDKSVLKALRNVLNNLGIDTEPRA